MENSLVDGYIHSSVQFVCIQMIPLGTAFIIRMI